MESWRGIDAMKVKVKPLEKRKKNEGLIKGLLRDFRYGKVIVKPIAVY